MRDNSRLFYAECTAFPSPVLVKVCLKPHTWQADADSARWQYEALLRVYGAMHDQVELSVPRPYLVRPDIGLLATEWVSGASVSELLFSWRCNSWRAKQLMAQSGRWLRRFHAAHALAPGRLDIEDKLAFIAEMETTRAVHDPVFFRALARLRESADSATAVTLERSWIHGDFKTDNLMVSGSRTVGIDIHLRHENPVIYDLASFLNHLRLRLCHPGGWRRAGSLRVLCETFLANYCGRRYDAGAVPLAWVQLYMILGEWYTARLHAGSWLRLNFVNLCYRGAASRLVRKLECQR